MVISRRAVLCRVLWFVMAVRTILADHQTNADIISKETDSGSSCDKYRQRRYLSQEEERLPPLLYSFQGSGNTWTRLLIEYSSGIYTGSVYSDTSLATIFPGEKNCTKNLAVIKAHPNDHPYDRMFGNRTKHISSDLEKCDKGKITRFDRAIILIRNPYDTFWAEYQRLRSASHFKGIKRHMYSPNEWVKSALKMSRQYHKMITIDVYETIQTISESNVLIIKHEDLLSSTKELTLKTMIDFIGLNTSDDRLRCAFQLSTSQVRRTVDTKNEISKDEAYNPRLSCLLWHEGLNVSQSYGYEPYGGVSCDESIPTSDISSDSIESIALSLKSDSFKLRAVEKQRGSKKSHHAEGARGLYLSNTSSHEYTSGLRNYIYKILFHYLNIMRIIA